MYDVLDPFWDPTLARNRVFAIYQMMGWKTYTWYFEVVIMKPTNSSTQGQPNPRNIRSKRANWATFSPTANNFFVGWDWFYIGNRPQET